VGYDAHYWSSSPGAYDNSSLYFDMNNYSNISTNSGRRSNGFSVRCFKNIEPRQTSLPFDTYTQTLLNAYDYINNIGANEYNYGSGYIEYERVYDSMTRERLAYAIAHWAEEVLGLKADTSIVPHFTDVSKESMYYEDIIKVAQMGLMGQNRTDFNPKGYTTKAEVASILSRALR
jgi:hypothetical protein